MSRTLGSCLLTTATLGLAGCWAAPVANLQPNGEPRLVQSGIHVQSVKSPGIVQSVDVDARTIVVRTSGTAEGSPYKVAPSVSKLDRIKAGDKVEITVAKELAVYVLHHDQLPGPGGTSETIAASAKVLSVNPSYCLLKVQYPDGQKETFKVALDVRLREMQAGDSIVIRTGEVVALSTPWF
jgi:Cu/Ag efflux protein CusF